jgi:hypothetical protein
VNLLLVGEEFGYTFIFEFEFDFEFELQSVAEAGFAFQDRPTGLKSQSIFKPGWVRSVATFFEEPAFDVLKKVSSG